MDFDLSSLSDPRDFPVRFSFLRDVDRELRCAICAEFIDSAVALPCCGVAYCSLCLRSALAAGEANCPNHLCRKPSSEASIRPISSINRIVSSWKAGRAELLALSKSAESTQSFAENKQLKTDETSTKSGSENGRAEESEIAIKETNRSDRSSFSAEAASTTRGDTKFTPTTLQPLAEIGNIVTEPVPEDMSHYSVRSVRRIIPTPSVLTQASSSSNSATDVLLVDDIFKSPPGGDQNATSGSSDGERCIVCNAKISPARMATHVEMHFAAEDRETRKRENEKSAEPKVRVSVGGATDRKPLPKLNYHIMQIKEIKSRCDALKLNSIGKKDKLIQRHRTYTLLFNANLDSVNPKTEQQLRAEVMRRERVGEGGGGDFEVSGSQTSLFSGGKETLMDDNAVGQKINKKSKPDVVEKVMKEYESSHRDQFSDLIVKAKMSREGARGKKEKGGANNEVVVVRSANSKEVAEEVVTSIEGSNKEATTRGESSKRLKVNNVFPILEKEESTEKKSFWAEWEAEFGDNGEDVREKSSMENPESEIIAESANSRDMEVRLSRPSSAALSISPFPAEQTPYESKEDAATPSSTGDERESSQDDVLSIVSHHAVTLSQSTPSPFKDRVEEGSQSSDCGLMAPPENELDHYGEDINTPIAEGERDQPKADSDSQLEKLDSERDLGNGEPRNADSEHVVNRDSDPNVGKADTETLFSKPNDLKSANSSKRSSHGNKRSLSPLMQSSYFSASPSKRQRTTDPLTKTTTITASTSPDIDSQMSYAAAQDVLAGDNRGSPILFPSNENSLDGTEEHDISTSPATSVPPNSSSLISLTPAMELPLPSATQQLDQKFHDEPEVDINRNSARAAKSMAETDEEEEIVCFEDEDFSESSSKPILRLSKGSSFLHHSKTVAGNEKGESVEVSSNSKEPFSKTSALSPPSSSVKSKPRNRKKVVPFKS